ncbi:accessory factor UbiK family protein [Oceanibaculum nanhaiense]|uniref:accessory factor UbiK family protein n=1 Tax=Oceanibaculum nanhaiense TaxID=1909734 RepID=UPI003F6E90D5
MQSQNRLFEDMAKLASGALGAAAGIRGEMEALFRQQMERVLHEMDLVTREEFEVVRLMAEKARMENEALAARLAVLEDQLAQAAKSPAKPAAAPAAGAARRRPKRPTPKS